jgi:hypothetical protein
MELKSTKQKTIYKNLMKRVVFDARWQIFQLKNFQTKIKMLKIKEYKQYYSY